MILVCNKLLKNTKIAAITLYPFVLLQKKELRNDKILINHETIHLRQQVETLVFFFYLIYVGEYYIRLWKLRNPYLAYKMISFEQEAYDNEANPEYLQHRKMWSFTKYWKK